MFAVKGWSVSADKLKSEATVTSQAAPSAAGAGAVPGAGEAPGAAPGAKPNKKRKRPGQTNVTADNVADLWERVIEHKDPKKKKKAAENKAGKQQQPKQDGEPRPGKKQKKSPAEKEDGDKSEEKPESGVAAEASPSTKKDKKQKNKKEKSAPQQDAAPSNSKDNSKALAPAAPQLKLTPLQAAMREKLISARFRHLNETLYTRPSTEAFALFDDSPEMFQEYHEGFRRQVDVWPENPVDSYVRELLLRGKAKPPHRGNAPPRPGATVPLPRTDGSCTVADLGCGDARLASTLEKAKRKLRLEIKSFDLQSPAAHVTRADIANLPLADGAVDVAIFCLALMGTNWLDFVEEAYRVLRWKGELWVAEIKSRFGPAGGKKGGGGKGVVEHSVGNRKKAAAGKKAGGGKKEGETTAAEEVDLAVEVDGNEDRRGATDVSAFVEALRKRGFLLAGEADDAVDLSNRMFVKMRFVKAAPPIKGKGAAKTRGAGEGGGGGGGGGPRIKKKFIEAADKEDLVDETSILKPCVYKIR